MADPAAGPGDLLAAVARVLGPDSPPVIAAAEADPALARLLRRRLLVHGVASMTSTSGPGPSCPTVRLTRT